MKNPVSTSEITQEDIDNLLRQLEQLRSSITTARETIAPLKTNLATAYNEFQAVSYKLIVIHFSRLIRL